MAINGGSKEDIQACFSGDYLSFYKLYLPDLKKKGKEYLAKCLFHEENEASLAVKGTEDKWYCHGCKAGGDLFSFYAKKHNLDTNGDFPKVCRGIMKDFGIVGMALVSNGKKKRKLVATYNYHCPNTGEVLFQKVRYEPKDFRIRRQIGNGKWKQSLGDDTKWVLYRMKDVLGNEEISVCEGEKDADNLAALGFAATTNYDGANKWCDEYATYFKDLVVNIFADNDEQGKKHAQMVAEKLHGVARSVRIIELPGLKDGEDVSDFIAEYIVIPKQQVSASAQ